MGQLRRTMPVMPVKVMQFGEGNFLRAFIDWMIDKMNAQGLFNGGVELVQPLERGMGDAINAQHGLYTLILRGFVNGKAVEEVKVIESVLGCINPYHEWQNAVATATAPTLRFVFSNTTEAGIEYRPEAYTPGCCQTTYPAKLCSLLFERYKAFDGAADKGLYVIPCELINHNGSTLKTHLLHYASDWQLPAGFARWIEKSCFFYNTLVDRIVAGYPRDEVKDWETRLGYSDPLLDCGEIFHFFVLEGSKKLLEEFPLDKAGINFVITDDQSPYRTRKVRFLNGTHTGCVPAAVLGGLTFVDEMMNDADFGAMARKLIDEEIYPTVKLPDAEKRFFADSIVERFLNPYAHHRLASILLNSVSKWKVRDLPTLKDLMAATGKVPPLLGFSLAALLEFYRNGDKNLRQDTPDILAAIDAAAALPTAELVQKLLADKELWDEDLTLLAGLTEAVTRDLEAIEKEGVRPALRAALAR